jgi:hypothetical protein
MDASLQVISKESVELKAFVISFDVVFNNPLFR